MGNGVLGVTFCESTAENTEVLQGCIIFYLLGVQNIAVQAKLAVSLWWGVFQGDIRDPKSEVDQHPLDGQGQASTRNTALIQIPCARRSFSTNRAPRRHLVGVTNLQRVPSSTHTHTHTHTLLWMGKTSWFISRCPSGFMCPTWRRVSGASDQSVTSVGTALKTAFKTPRRGFGVSKVELSNHSGKTKQSEKRPKHFSFAKR